MHIIKAANNAVTSLTEKSENFEISTFTKEYKKSKYNKFFKIDGLYIYNTFSGSVIKLEENEYKFFSEDEFCRLDKEAIKLMIKNRIFVPIEENEYQTYIQFISMFRLMKPYTGFSKYIILPTTACNARCFYCFEADFKAEQMSLSTADEIVKYILKTKTNGKITIQWFGGEPLCNVKVINKICALLKKSNVEFSSEMLTNGILFNTELVNTAVNDWNLKKVQITMDGMKEEHNKRKNYSKQFNDPFTQTIKSIENLLKNNINTIVRINIDLDNVESAEELINHLHDTFIEYTNLRVYPAMLYDSSECWNAYRTKEQQDLLFDKYLSLSDLVYKLKLHRPLKIDNKIKLYHCVADDPSSIVINQKGVLFTCDHCSDEMKIGDIHSGIVNKNLCVKWANSITIKEKCKQCIFLPECVPLSICPDYNYNCVNITDNKVKNKLLRFIEASR